MHAHAHTLRKWMNRVTFRTTLRISAENVIIVAVTNTLTAGE